MIYIADLMAEYQFARPEHFGTVAKSTETRWEREFLPKGSEPIGLWDKLENCVVLTAFEHPPEGWFRPTVPIEWDRLLTIRASCSGGILVTRAHNPPDEISDRLWFQNEADAVMASLLSCEDTA